MTEKKLFTLYINRQDGSPERPIEIPEVLRGRKFVLAVSPAYLLDGALSQSPRGVEQIQEAFNQGAILGQRGGLTDKCKYERFHRLTHTDPWHTNFCPYNPFGYSEEEQRENLSGGWDDLIERFKIMPKVYCPINHLFTSRTSLVTCGAFEYVMDRNMIGLLPYEDLGQIVIPEVNLPKKESSRESAAMYCALSDFRGENAGKIIRVLENTSLVLPSELPLEEVSRARILKNQILKVGYKLARDMKNVLG